jgi:polyribonucleotide nucleotidyltransferase
MTCKNCNQTIAAMDHNWASVCINCGNLTWLSVGQIVDATVDRMCQFGVFVNFGDNVEGMIHITEADAVEVSLTQEEVQYESVGRMGESFRSRND